jgi:hypothetical protein
MASPDVHKFAETLRSVLRRFMNDQTDNVALGGAHSFDEYNRLVGQIEGLAIAERELLNLLSSGEDEE